MTSSAPASSAAARLASVLAAAEHARAHGLAEFDGRETHAAAGTEHEQRLAGLQSHRAA